jgi:cytoskeletal protein RodZ
MTAPGSPPGPTRRERRQQQEQAAGKRRILIIVVVLLVVVAAAAAGWWFFVRDDDSTTSTSTSTSTSSSSTSSSTSTSTSTTASSSTSSTTAPVTPADPQAYAEALFSAWQADDRATAATVADQAAIDSLFATPSSEAAAYQFSGCQGAAGSIFCTWTRAGAQLAMTVRDATGGLPVQVVEVTIGPG